MRKILAPLIAAGMIFGMTACADDTSQDPEYARVCIDENTHERVDGAQCGSNDNSAATGFLWWYLIWGRTLPAYGAPVTGGYRSVSSSSVVEHDERYAPTGGTAYKKAPTRSYSTGSGKKLGTTSGGSGYKAPAPKPAQAPKVNNAPAPKAPAYKAPAPAPRPVAPAPRPAPIRIK